ncbi:MAG: alpha-galactosidase [Clostridia bacterium]|nr:alpha-galactosidase [Clostridia bacterium]
MIRNYRNPASDMAYLEMLQCPQRIPFTFTYDGKEYIGFGEDFTLTDKASERKGDTETAVLTFDFKSTLTFKVTLKHYYTHGVTEWVARIRNTSGTKCGIIEKLGTKMVFTTDSPILKGILGDHVNYYRPYSTDLKSENVSFDCNTGRATHEFFPYFNLEHEKGGTMLALGWSGTWKASFTYEDGKVIYEGCSPRNLKTYLNPNEEIRTALYSIADYTVRNEDYATNYWRSHYITNILPPFDGNGTPMKPFSTCCLAFDTGYPNSDGSISERYSTWKPSLEKMMAEDIKVDFRWVDAGWYVAPDKTSPIPFQKGHDWRDTLGTWEFDYEKWPDDTFRESVEFARDNGMRTLLWFATEKVCMPEELEKNYGYRKEWAFAPTNLNDNTFTSNLGDPECYRWTEDRIISVLEKTKVDMLREDNGSRCEYWTTGDNLQGENRDGYTEITCLDGHYRLWDKAIEATKSTGGCAFVDSCCGGGGRNDLESMHVGVPLLRSDHDRTSTGIRLSQTSSFNKWIPFCGACTREKLGELSGKGNSDMYIWRASYLPSLNVDTQLVYDPTQNFDILRAGIKEWKEINGYLLKEFYTLTPWHHENDLEGFTAYTYFDAEAENGILFVFRQEECEDSDIALDFAFSEGKELVLCDKDTTEEYETENGRITLTLPEKRCAKLYFYNLK